ncbi:MAG: S8/S53 family peptidase, partial [Candidatus Omnitrophota bacterium]
VHEVTYEYSEAGLLVKETNETTKAYKLFKDYHAGTTQAKYVEEWNAANELQVTYEYSQSGEIITKLEKDKIDNKWHKASGFVEKTDGLHATQDEVYSSAALTTLEMAIVYDYYDSGKIKTKEIYDNALLTKNTKYEKYTYTDAGVLSAKVYYFDGTSIDATVTETGDADNKWHKASGFVEKTDGLHVTQDEVYTDSALTTPEVVIVYDYYESGLIKTKTLSAPDVKGNVYYSYKDEDFRTQGYGRLNVCRRQEVTLSNEIVFKYEYYEFPNDNQARYVYGYSDIAMENLVTRCEYVGYGPLMSKIDYIKGEEYHYNIGTGLMISKILNEVDKWGNIHYAYENEDFREQGYGCVIGAWRETANDKGELAFSYEYYDEPNGDKYKFVYSYSDEGRDCLIAKYDYNETGKLIKETKSDSTYKLFKDYYPGTDQARYVEEYNVLDEPQVKYEYSELGVLVKATHTGVAEYIYYAVSGNLESLTFSTADGDGNIYYHYINETFDHNYNGQIDLDECYGRIDQIKRVLVDDDGMLAFKYSYFGDTKRVSIKECYSDTGFSDLKISYAYYDDSNNRMKNKTFAVADVKGNVFYHYANESFDHNSNGQIDANENYGRVDTMVKANGRMTQMKSWFDGTKTVKKEEDFTSMSNPVWLETRWNYSSGRLHKKLSSNGEAVIYHDVDKYKIETIWNTNGTIVHWETDEDYDNNKIAWYMDGVKYLETYTYYDSGRIQYKNQYKDTDGDGVWTWYRAAEYKDSGAIPFGDWDGGRTRSASGAPEFFTIENKPERTNVELLNSAYILEVGEPSAIRNVESESIGNFYTQLEELKNASEGGAKVTIALLDSGIDRDILDINIIDGYDFTDENYLEGFSYGFYDDVIGHGTLTAATISSQKYGVAPSADIMSLKIFDENAETTSSIVADAIYYAVDSGAKILSMPFSVFPMSDQLENAINYAYNKGAILITASGNDGMEILDASLAAQSSVITVGAVDNDGKMSAWSNYGSEIDLFAPWDVIDVKDNDAKMQGTSFSTAFVTGIVALMASENLDITAEEVLEALKTLTIGIMPEVEPENKEEERIRGVSVDEVVSLQTVQRMNQANFTGYSIVENVPDVGVSNR